MLHPNIQLMEDGTIAGRGLVATAPIQAGEVVSRLEPNQPKTSLEDFYKLTSAEQAALLEHGYQCSATHIVNESGIEKYMNHCCDPNTWWADDDTMLARRDIQAGEEITYDYATTEVDIPFEMDCACGAAICRGRVTNQDHQDPVWQARFGQHLPQHTLAAITRHNQQL